MSKLSKEPSSPTKNDPVSKALDSVMEVKLEKVQMNKITDFPAKMQEQLNQIMGAMKNNFAEQLKVLQEQFVNKQMAEVIKVYKTLEDNQKKVASFHASKKKGMDKVREELMKEKTNWDKAKDQLNKASRPDTEVVKFNISGTHEAQVMIATLNAEKESFLGKMFMSGDQYKPLIQEDGRIFIDRDGESFMHIINYLRDNKKTLPEFRGMRERKMFFRELDYWQIKTTHFVDAPAERYQHIKSMRQNQSNLLSMPTELTMEGLHQNQSKSYLEEQKALFGHSQTPSQKSFYPRKGSVQPGGPQSLNAEKYSKPFAGMSSKTPKAGRLRSGRKSLNVFKNDKGGLPQNQFGLPHIEKSPAEKEIQIRDLMKTMPAKKTGTGYQISDDLRKKWAKLGPFTVDHMQEFLQEWPSRPEARESDIEMKPISYEELDLGQSKEIPQIIAQLDKEGVAQGIGKKVSPYSLYEGQFRSNKRHGYGRVIYSSYCYIGQWENDRQHGFGKQVDVRGRVLEGLWDRNNFLGEIDELVGE